MTLGGESAARSEVSRCEASNVVDKCERAIKRLILHFLRTRLFGTKRRMTAGESNRMENR